MIPCPNCGKEVSEDALHCGHCGHRLSRNEQKKTMLGMGAIGAEWKEQLEAARAAAESGEDESAFAATAAMEAVSVQEDSAFAATEAMEAVGIGGQEAGDEFSAPTEAMEALPFGSQGDSSFSRESSEGIFGPGGIARGEGGLQGDDVVDSEDATMPNDAYQAQSPLDRPDEWEIGKLDSQVEADLAGNTFPPTVEEDREPGVFEASSPGEPEGDAGANWEAPAEEGGGNRKRLFLFLGVVGALFFLCCASSAAGLFFFGESLAELAGELEP